MRIGCAVMCVAGIVTTTEIARAGDLNPPEPTSPLAPWTRGAPGTTYNLWTFSTPAITPDASGSNPLLLAGQISNTSGSVWTADDGNGRGSGGWLLSSGGGFLECSIPSYNDPHPERVYIQLEYAYNGSIPQILVNDAGDSLVFGTFVGSTSPLPVFGGVLYTSAAFCLPYCPGHESIRITNVEASKPLFVDQLVVDTSHTPSPGAAALLAISGFVLARRRSRQAVPIIG
jgi:hypothetical protein